MKILFMEGYTSNQKDSFSSDTVGYGLTAAEALKQYFIEKGCKLTCVSELIHPRGKGDTRKKLSFTIQSYQKLIELPLEEYDCIFIFHCFQQFPGEIKKILYSLGKRDVPVVGYTHGSHWDPSDLYRKIQFPGMHIVDLACLHSLDSLLVVSEYMKNTLHKNISKLNPDLANEILEKTHVVGLPLNTQLIEGYKIEEKYDHKTIVFNHAFNPAKNPLLCLEVMGKILKKYDVDFVVTRDILAKSPEEKLVQKLIKKFPKQVLLGGTLSLKDYYRLLWRTHIQVSTATHESLGMATLEAMYTRNCCILPAQCCYPELVESVNEVLYPYTKKGLIEKLTFYIENEGERERVASLLAERSLDYRPEKVGDKVLTTLKEMVIK